MDQYFEAIEKAKRPELLKSFGYRNDTEDNISKSHVENIFETDAPSRGFVIEKKGHEIKDKLQKMLTDERTECLTYQTKVTTLFEKLSEKPSDCAKEVFYYMVDGWEDKLGDLPSVFSWNHIGCCIKECDCSSTEEKDENKLKYDYNEAVQKLIGSKREIALLETMLANFEDSKTYKLTVKEAAMLGW